MLINAYYLRAHMYTLVPHQVREDMSWIADVGSNIVSIAILEQDLRSAKSNIETICREASRHGMHVHAVPARWGGLFAGAPKVPSFFSVTHPETWLRKDSGEPIFSSVSGVISSPTHSATVDFFACTMAALLNEFPVRGVIWDEPKSLSIDLCGTIDLIARTNQTAREVRPDITLSLFTHATASDCAIKGCCSLQPLDFFGCDGRPWREADGGQTDGGPGKVLVGQADRFLSRARLHGKGGFLLIENHNMRQQDNVLMNRRLPEVLALQPDQLAYYYYPRNLEAPQDNMEILARHLRKAPSSH